MRNKKRIPLVLNYFYNNVHKLAEFCNIPIIETANILNDWKTIKKNWLKQPDLRFGQLLIVLDYLNDNNECWSKEEDRWLVEKGYCEAGNLLFWGRNYDENNNRLPKTEYILLDNLTDSHIKNILKFFESKEYKINKCYIEYFNKRLKK